MINFSHNWACTTVESHITSVKFALMWLDHQASVFQCCMCLIEKISYSLPIKII